MQQELENALEEHQRTQLEQNEQMVTPHPDPLTHPPLATIST